MNNNCVTILMGNGSVLDYIVELNTSKITEYVLSNNFLEEVTSLLKSYCENNPLAKGKYEDFYFKSTKCYLSHFMKTLNEEYKKSKFNFEDIIYFFDSVPSFFLSQSPYNKDLKEKFFDEDNKEYL